MRIRLKGLHWTTKQLADGSSKTFYYAWRGGPRVHGETGTPEFIASYNEAIAGRRIKAPSGTLQSLIENYQQSQKFLGLRERTRTDYIAQIKIIERDFGDFPLKALVARETRGVFLDWRDKLALKSRRQADYAWQVLALILAFAKDRGRITVNPCEKGGRLYNETRAEMIWSHEDEAAFLDRAPSYLHLALLLALWTGQRQGDLLALPWSAYDGKIIRLRQSKTGTRVVIPVAAPLKAALDSVPRKSPLVLLNSHSKAWRADVSHGHRIRTRGGTVHAGVAAIRFKAPFGVGDDYAITLVRQGHLLAREFGLSGRATCLLASSASRRARHTSDGRLADAQRLRRLALAHAGLDHLRSRRASMVRRSFSGGVWPSSMPQLTRSLMPVGSLPAILVKVSSLIASPPGALSPSCAQPSRPSQSSAERSRELFGQPTKSCRSSTDHRVSTASHTTIMRLTAAPDR
jgi:integrase